MTTSKSVLEHGDNVTRVEIVTTQEQLLHAFAIRAICFMEEHGVTARQTFDGNDFQATHLIMYSCDEPIGTLRIRWFKDFAKFERMSIRPAFREVHAVKKCLEFAFKHVARKGYDTVITHAAPKYARLWRMTMGFKLADKPPLQFHGHAEPMIELVKKLNPSENPITADSDPSVLFRIEGHWDVPSEFETANR